MRHTPGPWRVSNGHTYLVYGKADPKTDKPYGFVCSVGWTSTTDGKANAYLIAEAPNLLKLVEEAFDRFTDNDMQPPNQKLRDWLERATITLYQINPNAPGRE